MLDFISVRETLNKKSGVSISPEFVVCQSSDLMIRGGGFYAVWNEEKGYWSKDEWEVQRLADKMLWDYASQFPDNMVKIHSMKNFSTNKWAEWRKYCRIIPDTYQELDEKILFSNQEVKKTDYVTKSLSYPLTEGPHDAYDTLMNVLYTPEERQKLEWAIGSIIKGDSKWIQKFIVLYGDSGTGKSTILNIIQDMFKGYYSLFDARELGSNGSFSMESLKDNSLIAIQHDGDLSKIEDNTKLNSIISHEEMVVNEKYKSKYTTRFRSFLFMGTNKPVKISDSKSGIIRRLIDVTPTGNKVPVNEYIKLMDQIKFEYSGIAYHCLSLYESLGPHYYDKYVPIAMIQKTNDFYNFIEDNLDLFLYEDEDGLPLKMIWSRYKLYCDEANISYPMSRRIFKDEMKNYFEEYYDRWKDRYSVYKGFKREKLGYTTEQKEIIEEKGEDLDDSWLKFDQTTSEFDDIFKDFPAQYANDSEKPACTWDKCKTKLKDLDTKRLHYVGGLPENHVVIDFDLKGDNGEKNFQKNLSAAMKWPKTYAELSKSGCGIHLHYYLRDIDSTMLKRIYSPDIEIKTFPGKSSLRRRLSRCNGYPIAEISSGLPLKEAKSMITDFTIRSERELREKIKNNLEKKYHPNTKPSMDFIYKILNDAYNSDLKYDVKDLRPFVQRFALNSTHNADYCLRLISKMKFSSENPSENVENYDNSVPIVFFDVEVFPNLFVLCLKRQGKGEPVIKMINPKPKDVEDITKFRLVGFNNRKYDNHILYARMMGYTEAQLYELSQRIIVKKDKNAFFGEAYNLSYTDIYDFLSSTNKMSLKKWEIKLGIHHQECPYPWDQPVAEENWANVADYCGNDVIAAEETFNENQADWLARRILADLSGLTVNDTTNSHTKRIIVGKDKKPQSKYIYTNLATIFPGYEFNRFGFPAEKYKPNTKIVSGKSYYRGEDPGEGGYVFAKPGMYKWAAVLDIASMHPHSAIRLKVFGEEYTKRFEDIVEGRVNIKHGNYDSVRGMFDGKIDKWLNDPTIKPKDLANALKTAINSVYGLTSAKFENELKDPRNIDNIVAKYGALFMINLKHEVMNRGYTVVHIKTDSIKIADADKEIIQFVMDYGKQYGFSFEHESTYEKMCLVNDAVYIARYASPEECQKRYGYVPENNQKEPNAWTATGDQFKVPYVFKTLFSHEPVVMSDMAETKTVSTAMYLDFNEKLGEDEHDYRFVGRVGLFCPVKDGVGGGILLRQGDDKFSAVPDTKKKSGGAYRWMEEEMVRTLGLEDAIDRGYYDELVDKAIETISKYGDFERFASDEPGEDLSWMSVPDTEEEELPFEQLMNAPIAA